MERQGRGIFGSMCSEMMVFVVTAVILVTASCSSKSEKSGGGDVSSQEEKSTLTKVAQSRSEANPGIDLNCVYDRIQNPKEPFSYSFTKDSSDDTHIAQEADITPQSINGRYRGFGNDHASPLQASRSKPEEWQTAIVHLTAISGMSSTIALVNHNSAMKREPDGGTTNGYDTIHYSIDTARFDNTERQMLLSPGDSEKGDAWVTPEGCPVKLVLDSELHRRDGSFIEKIHYEESMVKK